MTTLYVEIFAVLNSLLGFSIVGLISTVGSYNTSYSTFLLIVFMTYVFILQITGIRGPLKMAASKLVITFLLIVFGFLVISTASATAISMFLLFH